MLGAAPFPWFDPLWSREGMMSQAKASMIAAARSSGKLSSMTPRLLLMSMVCLMLTTYDAFSQVRGGALTSAGVARGGPLDLGPTSYIPPYRSSPVDEASKRRAVAEILEWAKIGKCVANEEPRASSAYVAARPASQEAMAAERELDPIFSRCLATFTVRRPGNKSLRRAAIADALRVKSRS